MIKQSCITISFCLAIPFASAHADSKLDSQAAIDSLSQSIVFAEQAITEVRGQEAINLLTASVANAEVTIALANATETINAVSDDQMLAELDTLLDGSDADTANGLIMAVVAERPVLASAIQDMAITAGYDEAMVASSVVNGLGDAAATAAGN